MTIHDVEAIADGQVLDGERDGVNALGQRIDRRERAVTLSLEAVGGSRRATRGNMEVIAEIVALVAAVIRQTHGGILAESHRRAGGRVFWIGFHAIAPGAGWTCVVVRTEARNCPNRGTLANRTVVDVGHRCGGLMRKLTEFVVVEARDMG